MFYYLPVRMKLISLYFSVQPFFINGNNYNYGQYKKMPQQLQQNPKNNCSSSRRSPCHAVELKVNKTGVFRRRHFFRVSCGGISNKKDFPANNADPFHIIIFAIFSPQSRMPTRRDLPGAFSTPKEIQVQNKYSKNPSPSTIIG